MGFLNINTPGLVSIKGVYEVVIYTTKRKKI